MVALRSSVLNVDVARMRSQIPTVMKAHDRDPPQLYMTAPPLIVAISAVHEPGPSPTLNSHVLTPESFPPP